MTGIIKAGHYPFLIISAVLFLIFFSIKKCIKKSAKYTLAGLLVFCLVVYFVLLRNQCYYWKLGING